MGKIRLDKYYTPKDVALELINITKEVIPWEQVTDIIEPSAGDGAFSTQLDCTAYDIEPEHPSIIEADFLKEDIPYKKGRLCIGNPPFGATNSKSVSFFKKCSKIGDYVAFIQPITQLNNNLQMYDFDLIYSKDLGLIKYSDRNLHCCFNIYKRPENGKLNKRQDYTLNDVEILEYRRFDAQRKENHKIREGWDHAMCNWGDGCLGKVPNKIGQYSCEVYFYVHNKKFLPRIKELLEFKTIRSFVQSMTSKRISKMRLYKYLRDNIEGIQ